MICNFSEQFHIEKPYICDKQSLASFDWLFSVYCMKLVRMAMTLSNDVSFSLFIHFYISSLFLTYLEALTKKWLFLIDRLIVVYSAESDFFDDWVSYSNDCQIID